MSSMLIDYGLVRGAAKDAVNDVRADLGRISSNVQAMMQELGHHSGHMAAMHNSTARIANVEQQIGVLTDQVIGLNARLDQLTAHLQNLIARLPQ